MSDTPLSGDQSTAAAPAPPTRGKVFPILLAMNSVAAVGALLLVLLRPAPATAGLAPAAHGPAAEAEAGPANEGHGEGGAPGVPGARGADVKLTDLVVRLKNPDADRYVRVSFNLELAPGQNPAMVDPLLPRVRDAFISDLSDRTLEELQGAEALAQLKRGLLERLNALMPSVRVRALYITEFIVQ